mmetsp:Transcript_10631/g.25991  ORF Transcript_10631/g.25991 Transcript_10631/m.25991 type:complete len:350 (+) Transcript_10631:315-1364(+)
MTSISTHCGVLRSRASHLIRPLPGPSQQHTFCKNKMNKTFMLAGRGRRGTMIGSLLQFRRLEQRLVEGDFASDHALSSRFEPGFPLLFRDHAFPQPGAQQLLVRGLARLRAQFALERSISAALDQQLLVARGVVSRGVAGLLPDLLRLPTALCVRLHLLEQGLQLRAVGGEPVVAEDELFPRVLPLGRRLADGGKGLLKLRLVQIADQFVHPVDLGLRVAEKCVLIVVAGRVRHHPPGRLLLLRRRAPYWRLYLIEYSRSSARRLRRYGRFQRCNSGFVLRLPLRLVGGSFCPGSLGFVLRLEVGGFICVGSSGFVFRLVGGFICPGSSGFVVLRLVGVRGLSFCGGLE